MELLRFTVRNQNLSGGKVRLVSDSIDYAEASFDFRTDDWNGLSKWAHFTKGETTFDVNLSEDKITRDMHLNLEAGRWEVKLHGTDPEGKMRITTDSCFIYVDSYGSFEEGDILPEIPLSAAEQIDAKSQAALGTANKVLEMAEGGKFVPVAGVDYWTEEDKNKILLEAAGLVKEGNKGDTGTGIRDIIFESSFDDGGINNAEVILTDGRKYGLSIMNGTKGNDGKTGSPGLVWKGEWNAETSYGTYKDGQLSRDVVSYNGSSYVVAVNSTAPVKGVVPEGDTSGSWEILAKKGFGVDEGDYSERLSEVEKEIEDLKYVPVSVLFFGHDAGIRENGDFLDSVLLSWELNKDPASVMIDGKEADAERKAFASVSEKISETRNFELLATDERGAAASESCRVWFLDGVYYGCSEKPQEVESEFILSLEKKLSSGKNLSIKANGGENKFFWYAYPKEMGNSIFNIGGFDYEFASQVIPFENKFGVIKDYIVYVSDYPMISNLSVTVKEG